MEDLYNKNYLQFIVQGPRGNSSPKIPKRIHQIWLGSKFPKSYRCFVDEWIRYHPKWEFYLWTEKEARQLSMANRKLFESSKNLGTKADILRYEILYKYGGLYVDTDFLCIKPFDDLLSLDFFCGNGHLEKALMFNGLIACREKHPIIKRAIDSLAVLDIDSKENCYDSILDATGPDFLSRMFFSEEDRGRSVVFPTTFFYPFPATLRFQIRGKFTNKIRENVVRYAQTETYCIHLWYTSWQR
jgi:mannosyltransferase OCH1-like enzyme